jgi:hypothetical protein
MLASRIRTVIGFVVLLIATTALALRYSSDSVGCPAGGWDCGSHLAVINALLRGDIFPVIETAASDAGQPQLYSLDGSVSVALIKPNRAAFSSSAPLGGTIQERAAAFSEYFGYVGAFRYRNGLVYHDVEHCSYPNWSGSSLLRFASLDEQGLLTLSTHPVEIGGSIGVQQLVWRRKG